MPRIELDVDFIGTGQPMSAEDTARVSAWIKEQKEKQKEAAARAEKRREQRRKVQSKTKA